ncbi:4'-phosphopantetheinyl transferase family protein [Winogradskyella sp. UBA3174]|uniref:4'-phosphopantetheinyl transferase family protein n=1 Tax=Winogradskyella sp. UBA3174 TaxID=1947785 RepID=UPI0025E33809|nr:4'-phosphopantetheinyl transferase superfamily protein [Winogradskyella sp. UBA3174]|tara:strand:+ start:3573 stop:4148 length:576 start_codon:yes stop_codon:yes gene_type:complete
MIGNDIVDISEAKQSSNWERPRFLDKLFTPREQQLIKNSDNLFLMVWRLWSMKESAYKLYTQLNPSRFYNPKQFECEINDSEGEVIYKDFRCYLKTKTTSQYIMSEARLDVKDMISESIKLDDSSPKNQSEAVKNKLFSRIAEHYIILKKDLKLIKSEFGIPEVYYNSKKLNISISISHHGNCGAYGILQV